MLHNAGASNYCLALPSITSLDGVGTNALKNNNWKKLGFEVNIHLTISNKFTFFATLNRVLRPNNTCPFLLGDVVSLKSFFMLSLIQFNLGKWLITDLNELKEAKNLKLVR